MREITPAEEKLAKANGWLVVFGASDDLMELRGAIYDEVGACDGGTALVTRAGQLLQEPDVDETATIEKFGFLGQLEAKKKDCIEIKAHWCPDGEDLSWKMTASVPCETFDVMEDGEVYCRGVVVQLP